MSEFKMTARVQGSVEYKALSLTGEWVDLQWGLDRGLYAIVEQDNEKFLKHKRTNQLVAKLIEVKKDLSHSDFEIQD